MNGWMRALQERGGKIKENKFQFVTQLLLTCTYKREKVQHNQATA